MKIRGKEYMEVKDRVMVFRKNHPEWAIITEIVENNESTGSVIFKAHIEDEEGRIRGTGHAHEFKDDKTSMVNKTSHLENCETSAIGRAMASLGIGVESSYASYDEVMIAKSKEARPTKEQTEEEIKYVGNDITDQHSTPQGWLEENDPVAVQEEKTNWRDTICPFPKHKGKTLGQVESEDPNYLNWILGLDDIKSDEIKNAVEQALKEKSDNGKQGFKRVA
ncbi:MAG: hypothetical protein EBT51_12075, partial [Flavobacteriaceae bacterium]|nr:hypothetical protein [Flavobacteriaceae bacterium]